MKFWSHSKELPGQVALSLQKTIKMYPAVGWVRGNAVATSDNLQEINELRKENERLKHTLGKISDTPKIEGLVGLDDVFEIHFAFEERIHTSYFEKEISIAETWSEIFKSIAFDLLGNPSESDVRRLMVKYFGEKYELPARNRAMANEDFRTIATQLELLGLIKRVNAKTTAGGTAIFWNETPVGRNQKFLTRALSVKVGSE